MVKLSNIIPPKFWYWSVIYNYILSTVLDANGFDPMIFFIRIKVYIALALPHLLCGNETWTLRKKDKNDWHQSRRKFSE
jgi:hypothetical protein